MYPVMFCTVVSEEIIKYKMLTMTAYGRTTDDGRNGSNDPLG